MHNLEEFLALQKQIRAWRITNFGADQPYRLSFLGMMEEAGELCHAVLKLTQGIRGTREEHIAEMKDAIGDIMVYTINFHDTFALDYIYSLEDIYTFHPQVVDTDDKFLQKIQWLSWQIYRNVAIVGNDFQHMFFDTVAAGPTLTNTFPSIINKLLRCLHDFCLILDTTLAAVLEDTWQKVVSKRDWKTNPVDGVAS